MAADREASDRELTVELIRHVMDLDVLRAERALFRGEMGLRTPYLTERERIMERRVDELRAELARRCVSSRGMSGATEAPPLATTPPLAEVAEVAGDVCVGDVPVARVVSAPSAGESARRAREFDRATGRG